MRVVSNTSPISNLAIISRLELLKRRYRTVLTEIELLRSEAPFFIDSEIESFILAQDGE
jgi:predicted nucleic acid-binding protein